MQYTGAECYHHLLINTASDIRRNAGIPLLIGTQEFE
jgi:hypothetical protein